MIIAGRDVNITLLIGAAILLANMVFMPYENEFGYFVYLAICLAITAVIIVIGCINKRYLNIVTLCLGIMLCAGGTLLACMAAIVSTNDTKEDDKVITAFLAVALSGLFSTIGSIIGLAKKPRPRIYFDSIQIQER